MQKPASFFLCIPLLLAVNLISCTNAEAFSLISQNLQHFYDNKVNGGKEKVLSTKKYIKRIQQLVDKVSKEFHYADVMAFQEIENIEILQEICKQIKKRYNKNYQPVLIEGNDISGIDVGFIVSSDFKLHSANTLFSQYTVQKSSEKLFSRPPLVIEICQQQCLTIVNIHLRSMKGLHSSRRGKRTALKRRLQAETLAKWINQFQNHYPDKKLLIVGDFNSLTPSDPFVDSLGTIIGNPDQNRPAWKSPDLVLNDLIDTSLLVSPEQRFSYRFRKNNQLLDYLLVSKNMQSNIKSIKYSAIDYKFSDHAALIALFDIK